MKNTRSNEAVIGLASFILLYRTFSKRAFGPADERNNRESGVIDHIKKELKEIKKAETQEEKMLEWVDVILLGIDGAWRTGCTPSQIALAIYRKYEKNKKRDWPDWRKSDPTKALEHRRGVHD